MNIYEIIKMIKEDKQCEVYVPCGEPMMRKEDKLPDDIKVFYELCGGIRFFKGSKFEFIVVPPNEVILANPVIVGELCEEDISSKWYIICKDLEENYITFDSSVERNGRCYDSFWDRHGVVGECAVVALSFSELLINLYKSKGEQLFWLADSFKNLGDAYDE